MEVYQKMVTGGTLHEVDTIVHVLLVLTTEEIYLHTSNANLLTPCELLLAVLRLIQAKLRRRSAIDPTHRGVVPNHRLHATRLSVVDSILNGLSVLHTVPLGINQHVGQFQRSSQIRVLLNDIVVV